MTIPAILVGDHDRRTTADLLSHALAQGYFDLTEYETRVQAAFAADTAAQLHQLVADLPVEHLRRTDPRQIAARQKAVRTSVRLHLAGYAVMVTIVLAIWLSIALTTGETAYFWPVWPILGGAIGLLGHAIPARLGITPPMGLSCRNMMLHSIIRR